MKVLIFGAGAVGRGLVGSLFSRAGHVVWFVDSNANLIEYLQKRDYWIERNALSGENVLRGPCMAIRRENVNVNTLHQVDVIFVCVRVENLHDIAPLFVRKLNSYITNVVVCENTPNASSFFKKDIMPQYNFVNAIADAVIPEVPHELSTLDPTLTYTDPRGELLIDSTNWVGERPNISGIRYPKDFAFRWDCKWYLHCALHFVIGAFGLAKGKIYVHEALQDKEINAKVRGLMKDVFVALVAKYPESKFSIKSHIEEEFWAMSDSTRPDTCARVTRDKVRKLQKGERVMDLLELVGGEHAVIREVIDYAIK